MNKKISSIGIICDGNRRWAVKNGMKKTSGHKYGVENISKIIKAAKEEKIEDLTFYIFSTENWNRAKTEIKILMSLFETKLKRLLSDKFKELDAKVNFVGRTEDFSKTIQKIMKEAEEKTKNNKSITVNFAVSYGGKAEIVDVIKKISITKTKKELLNIKEADIDKNIWTKNIKDPEIIIRTGGNKRLSNFLLWKSAYSEIFFTDTMWPDFSPKEFKKIIQEYKNNAKINKGK